MPLYPTPLAQLIEQLKKLPGVGKKTAERFAFKIIEWPEKEQKKLASTLEDIHKTLVKCPQCGCFQQEDICPFCHRTFPSKTLCVIASAKEAYAIEHTKTFHGYYHVLGCLLSPLEGKTPEHLHLHKLKERILTLEIEELILALDPTLEGDATSLYLHEFFASMSLKITRLALGLPLGSSLDFIDEGTLTQAFQGRLSFAAR
ncbi:MAG: recombination protein RecR [Chlamydiae bacterium]|nr:recombination protein RecR [Chlamydiota bacterium]